MHSFISLAFTVKEIFQTHTGDIFEFPYVFSNLLENKGLIMSQGVSVLYMFKCLLTGDTYVGSAVDLGRRFSEHG
jgi:hypothetical protein